MATYVEAFLNKQNTNPSTKHVFVPTKVYYLSETIYKTALFLSNKTIVQQFKINI